MRKKDQINLESKIKTVRFIGKKFVICKLSSSYYDLEELTVVEFLRKNLQWINKITFSVSRQYSNTEWEKFQLKKVRF